MVEYTEALLKEKVKQFGEVFVVLDSDREYEIHGMEQLEISEAKTQQFKEVRVEGMQDGEWVVAEFPLDAIEHVYTHREV